MSNMPNWLVPEDDRTISTGALWRQWSLATHISNFDDIGQCWICAVLWRPFWKWWPLENFQCLESIRDIIIYLHMKCCWNRTMLNLYGIVTAILKMAIARNFSMSGHHNLPTYEYINMATNHVMSWFSALQILAF